MAAPDPLRERLEAALGDRFALTRELGGGGMSRVFVATERALGREVVIKALPDDVAAMLSAERFEREIRLVASLQQANIVPVLASGTAGGTPWFSMPFVAGESVRQRLGDGPMSEPEAIAILRDVARALAFAHDRGVIHRDIKPDNILLSGDAAVVTDFGIAKAVTAARGGSATSTSALTSAGVSLGTPAYMAPEQVMGDGDVDARADLYALGCVAFELLAGAPPFGGSAAEVARGHLTTPPPPLRGAAPHASKGYAALVGRLLAKSPGERPASAREVARALDDVAGGGFGGGPPPSLPRALATWGMAAAALYVVARAAVVGIGLPVWTSALAGWVAFLGLPLVLATWWIQRTARRAAMATPTRTPGGTVRHGTLQGMAVRAGPIVTWRRTRRAGWAAAAAVAAVVAVTMILRPFGIGPAASLRGAGRVSADARVLLSEFTSSTGDASLGEALTQAMREALSGSSAVSVVRPAVVGQVLRQMARDPATPLTPAVAFEVAQRDGIPLVVSGGVATAGNGFLVTVRLLSADSGTTLATFQRAANTADDLLAAVDRVARDLRSRVGESLRDVARTPALERVTTTSLPALRAYSHAVQLGDVQGDFAAGLAALREAVAIDSTFASAWRKAAAYANNIGERRSVQFAFAAAAYRHRERTAGEERAFIEAYYVGELGERRATEAYGRLRERQINQALMHNVLGEFASADSIARLDMAGDSAAGRPPTVQGITNLMMAELGAGKLAEARRTGQLAEQRFGNVYFLRVLRGSLGWASGGPDSLEAFLRREGATRNPNLRADLAAIRAAVAGMRGELRAFAPLTEAALGAGTGLVNLDEPVDMATWRIVTSAVHRRQERQGLAQLDSLLRARPQEGLPALDRRDAALAIAYARLGRPDRASSLLSGLERALSREERLVSSGELRVAAGEIALAQGRIPQAIAAFREAAGADSGRVVSALVGGTDAELARAFDKAGQSDSAVAHYERVATSPAPFSYLDAPLNLPVALLRLGELYEARGDMPKAIDRYRRFATLWRNADPELQPVVADVRGRIARLEAREARGR